MAVPSNTTSTTDIVGIRESLHDSINDVSPELFPFQDMCDKVEANSTFEEWQTDSRRAANGANGQLEGDDVPATAPTATVRIGNRTQIFAEAIIMSSTAQDVRKAGRTNNDEMARLMTKKTLELKQDLEQAATGASASVQGSETVIGRMAGMETMTSIVAPFGATGSGGTGYVNGAFSGANWTAVTDGTQRAFTEANLKTTMLTLAQNSGMKARTIMMSPTQKVAFSAFTGISANRVNTQPVASKMASLVGAVEYYMTDFGMLKAVVNLYMRTRTALILDGDGLELAFLHKWQRKTLPSGLLNEKKGLFCEVTLRNRDPKANAKVADLT